MSGTLTYWVSLGGKNLKSLRLTLCAKDDFEAQGLVELRRRRLCRLLSEAQKQGARLSYRDLSLIMLTSRATLKRDLNYLRHIGSIPRRG